MDHYQEKKPSNKTAKNKGRQTKQINSEQVAASTSELPMDGFRYDYDDNA